MKIKVKYSDKKMSKNYFDENLYVVLNFKKIIKNPKKKVKKYSSVFLFNYLILLFFLIISFICQINSLNFEFTLLISSITVVYIIYSLLMYKNYINTFVKKAKQEIIEINDIGILNDDGNMKIQINWDSIQVIVINKYTISVIPKNEVLNNIIISISTKYKNEFIKELKKYNKEFLLVDNSARYKK